jgi:hypothetical protein
MAFRKQTREGAAWMFRYRFARLKHPKVPRRYLDKYLLPAFGERVPADITPADAARLVAPVRKSAWDATLYI